MKEHSATRSLVAVLKRECQEHRGMFFWTPIGLAAILLLITVTAVVLKKEFSEGSPVARSVIAVIMEDIELPGWELTIEGGPQDADPVDYTVEQEAGEIDESLWNFSADWSFGPLPAESEAAPPGDDVEISLDLSPDFDDAGSGLNSVLHAMNTLFVWIMLLVLGSYLLGALFNDRRDASILYWKSMPLADSTDVIARLLMAMGVVPLVFISISIVTQFLWVLLVMLASETLVENPAPTIWNQLSFAPLFIGQIGGWVLCALVAMPVFAWLLLASAAARRSPFLLAVVPVIALLVIDHLVLGTGRVGDFIVLHLPRPDGVVHLGQLQVLGVSASSLQWSALIPGIIAAIAMLAGAVYLRKYRFEI